MLYYHGSPHVFPVGHIIIPGAHGDRHRRFMMPQLTYMFESACEDIRLQYFFQQKPSRFNCIFACEDITALDLFCSKFGSRDNYYEIRPVDPSVLVHRGTWNLPYGNELHGMVNCAWAYWSQVPKDSVEIIVGGDVRVERKLK